MVGKQVLRTVEFERSVKRIKDKSLKDRIIDKLEKIVKNPEIGKPLRYSLKGERTVHIKPYRIIYTMAADKIVFLKFKHRKDAYKN